MFFWLCLLPLMSGRDTSCQCFHLNILTNNHSVICGFWNLNSSVRLLELGIMWCYLCRSIILKVLKCLNPPLISLLRSRPCPAVCRGSYHVNVRTLTHSRLADKHPRMRLCRLRSEGCKWPAGLELLKKHWVWRQTNAHTMIFYMDGAVMIILIIAYPALGVQSLILS